MDVDQNWRAGPVASQVLGLKTDVSDFVRDQIQTRNLALTIRALNKELLHGTSEHQIAAKHALERLGFV
jgi:hypothetical protein